MKKKKRLKRYLALALSVLMLLTMVPFAVFADETASNGNVVEVTEASQLTTTTLKGGTTYVLQNDITTEMFASITVNDGSVTLDLGGKELILGLGSQIVISGATLILKNGTINASKNSTEAIVVNKEGTLKLHEDVKIVSDTDRRNIKIGATTGKISVSGKLSNSYSVLATGKNVGDTLVVCDSNENALANNDKFVFYKGADVIEASVVGNEIKVASGKITCTNVSLVLDGSINVKFYFAYSEENIPTTLHYTVGSGVEGEIAVAKEVNGKTIQSTAFIIAVTPDKYKEDVTVWFDDNETRFVYSVSEYIEYAPVKYPNSKLAALTEALKVYCDSVIAYSNSADVAQPTGWSDAIKETLERYKSIEVTKSEAADPHVRFEGMSVILASNTKVRMHVQMFNNSGTSEVISYKARVLKNKENHDIWYNTDFDDSTLNGVNYIDIEIPVAEFDDTFRVEIGYLDSNDVWVAETSIEVCLNYYCYTVINADPGTYSENLVNLVKALYLYSIAADDYFGI